MSDTRNEDDARREVLADLRERLVDRVRRSVTSAAADGRTVERPEKAAEYVVNALTVHDTALLAEVALMFAGPELALLLSGSTVVPRRGDL